MNAHHRSLRERLAQCEFDVRKQEIKVLDCEASLAERKKNKEENEKNKFAWTDDSQFYLEDLELQLMVDKLILAKLVHLAQHTQAQLAKIK
jgi:CRISPR/Cas system CMR subunit Cmr4 (Cas7 group RAMP superfamily)